MAVVKAGVIYPDAVPDALMQAFTNHLEFGSNGHPSKRRKLISRAHSLREINGLSVSLIPNGYIPLAQCHLQLDFAPNTHLSLHEWSRSAGTEHNLPVLIKTTKSSPFDGDEVPDDHVVLELQTVHEHRTIFVDSFTKPDVVRLGKHLEIASGLMCADRYHTLPTVCYQSTLHHLTNLTSFRLETVILWKDSLEIVDYRKLPVSALKAFSIYLLRKEFDGDPYARRKNQNALERDEWTPRDFYDNVHITPDIPSLSAPVKCDMIDCDLFPFQRRALRWLLKREGKEFNAEGKLVKTQSFSNTKLPESFQQVTDADGQTCFASHLHMIVTRDLSKWYDIDNHLKGGILAEEMGLGKTVEMISLVATHRRMLRPEETFAGSGGGLKASGATLIITPPVILEQWKQEIEQHAPGLQVFHYTGIHRHQALSDQEMVELMADNDVVLTTYNVLAREIHYAGHAPKRNLRYEKRFEARKSPLVKISWWRVCLDEAQMIESGVSNAAKVARLIPREMAWAVTGTPLRKDITDLLGLLLFLSYEPFCGPIWKRLCAAFHPVLARIVNTITLRHSKDLVRKELHLPPQKRVVITVPFTAVEEQNYRQLYEEMCDDCGLDFLGAPRAETWNLNDLSIIDRMRGWLVRLRQTCLYTAGNRRRGFATNNGPLRSVNEVLEAMIDQNDALIHAEERGLLLSQLRRGQLLENAKRKQEALDLWKTSLDRASEIVRQCRERLHMEQKRQFLPTTNGERAGRMASISDDEGEEIEKNTRLSAVRQKLRGALEIEHISIFFTGNAYYQIKSDPAITKPDSEDFLVLTKLEEEAYAKAKLIRQEMLIETSRKAKRYVKKVKEKSDNVAFVIIPKMKPQLYSKGLESRRVLDRLMAFCDKMNEHAVQYNEWRQQMVELLSHALLDQEDDSELEGDEYEKSTKHQDEMYVYMEALRALFADRHDALTGQTNVLIAHEVKVAMSHAQKGEGASPKLYLEVMRKRSQLKPGPELGSLRAVITELRSLGTALEWQANEGSSRARAELEIVTMVLKNVVHISTEQTRIVSSLEKEVEMFRDTMNHRLEYYRQLQQISDTVAPYDEESAGKPLDHELFISKLEQEDVIDGKISSLRAKGRYLIHLQDESGADETSKICIICQNSFENGVVTQCGHLYCADCLRLWWRQHRNCPTCKKRLKANDFYQITYKPQEFVVQEEKFSRSIQLGHQSKNSIYTDIASGTLHQIKNIDLKDSFGTKIDTLARHILWLREHDPGAQAVVFSQYRSFLQYLATAFKRFQIGYSSVDDFDGIQKFKNDPAVECFLLHAKAHSSGLNLTNATHVFLCEPLINTAIELQAIARVHRIGQHRPSTVWMYLVSGTVEQSIYDISVSRRLDHIIGKQQEKKPGASTTIGAVVEDLSEVAIDSANSLEMQDAPLAKLMEGGVYGGELVKEDDLWRCLFGNLRQQQANSDASAGGDVARLLRAETAEKRRTYGEHVGG